MVLPFEQGTNLFEKTAKDDLAIFWRFTSELSLVINKARSLFGGFWRLLAPFLS